MADPIKHVILLMLENHSFDQMLGSLQGAYDDLDGIDIEAETSRFNLDDAGSKVFQAPTSTQQVKQDPKHETENVLKQIANGNSGFVTDFQASHKPNTAADRQLVMSYYPLDFLPALHQLARNFTVCDRWFSSLPGPTWPNRFFALSGTSAGRVLMPEGLHNLDELNAQDQDTVFDRLNEAGRSWRVYYYDFPQSLVLRHQRRPENLAQYSQIKNFFVHVTNEKTFPSFAFIEPKYFGLDQNDDHPPHNVFKAEKLVADVYNAIRSSDELWRSSLLVVTFDEHGGFYDHVEPPPAVPPDNRAAEGFAFDRLGVRVPAILVSPWVEASVEKTVFDHTSLLKYLVDKWGLGPLGARTASATSIGLVIGDQERMGVLPFIRVPYTNLIPPNPDLEENDVSKHHEALEAFGLLFANEGSAVSASVVQALARGAGLWLKFRSTVGYAFKRFGEWVAGAPERRRAEKVWAMSEVAKQQISKAQITVVNEMMT